MRIVSIGGGPAGLFLGILMKKADPRHEVLVLERNRPQDTFGFGVVFSDRTLDGLAEADAETQRAISASFAHWDDIEIHFKGQTLRSTGHGFAGLSRQKLLEILCQRAEQLGVELRFEHEVERLEPWLDADLVLGADGVNSMVREQWAEHFGPDIDLRPNRFVWLGTTYPFEAFTFYFNQNQHGLWRVHAYRYAPDQSTFIVECTEDTWLRAGMDQASEDDTTAYCEELFAKQLAGHRLLKNRSIWRQFPTVSNRRWHHRNVVLLGDAVHTAHFSIGSGTKLALEDAIALADALKAEPELPAALERYERERRPVSESLQRAAQVSLEWFENTERYMRLEPVQFGFSLLTRSLRVTHANLALRDPDYVARVDRWFASHAARQIGSPVPEQPRPPMLAPFKLRELVLPNRVVVSPMCQYMAEDGVVGDWHLVHLGSRALGGAGLVISEMTDVAPEARITPGCAGLWSERHADAWRRIVDFVHQHSEARIGVQLAHAGRKGSTCVPWLAEGDNQPLGEGGWPLVAPSPIAWGPGSPQPREMSREDMERVREQFVNAARLADAAGFDLLELHCAHGYLLGTFISPLSNRRQDDWGGSLEGRARFPLEVLAAVRAVWPDHKPISVRISATDWHPEGTTAEDSVRLARLLAASGCDIVDVSAGQTVPDQRPVYGRAFQTPFAERIRLEAGVPTIAVGNISSYSDVNSILAAGRADLVALARAHLYEPYWTRHATQRQGITQQWAAPYSVLNRYTPRLD